MVKRGKLEIIKDVLNILRQNGGKLNITPLLRKTNLSSSRFKEYYLDLLEKGFILEEENKGSKIVLISKKGQRFLDKYNVIVSFVNEFGL